MGFDWADKLYHLSYGMISLPSGRIKSREGQTADAEDLMDEMHAQAERDHAKLDSPESYRYTQSLCRGWKPAKARRGTG